MKRCRECLLPAAVPGAALDAEGVCAACRAYSPQAPSVQAGELLRKGFEADLEAALSASRGRGQYDVLVPFSGGKDSAWLLYKLAVEYRLRVLAFTVNVNLPDLAWRNIRHTLARLAIDHLSYAPPDEFYRRLFAYLLRHQEARGAVYTVSYVYAPLFEGDAIRMALEKDIPLVLAGYSPGQPDPARMHYEFSRKLIEQTDWTPPELARCGHFSAADLGRFFNPAQYPPGTRFPRYLAPFHAWPYDQAAVMRQVVAEGLVADARHASPVFSNYPINWLLMYSDLAHFGYNPYAPEFCTLIREGKASRTAWRVLAPLVDGMVRWRVGLGRDVSSQLDWLGLRAEDLRITLPAGAYDPVLPS